MKIVFTAIVNHLKDNEPESDGFPPTNTPNMAQNPYFGPIWADQPDFGPGILGFVDFLR